MIMKYSIAAEGYGLKLVHVGRETIEAFDSHILTKSWPNVKNVRTA